MTAGQLDLLDALAATAPDDDPRHLIGPRFVCGWCQNATHRGGTDHRLCSTTGHRGRHALTCQCTCRLTGQGLYEGQAPSWLPG